MAVVDMSFCFGFLLGLVVVVIFALAIFVKKRREFLLSLNALEVDKKQLSEHLVKAQSETSVLSEKASQANFLKDELNSARSQLEEKRDENSRLVAKTAQLATENEKSAEFFSQRMADLIALQQNMKEAFATLSKDALIKNSDLVSASFKQTMEHFFKVNERERAQNSENLSTIMKPLKESLVAVDKKVGELETSRQGAYAGLKEQIEGLLKSQSGLQRETQNLSRALSAPTIRGRWGEMQLRRVVELSGLSSYCDFVEQKTLKEGDDVLRPDMIVTLPQNKKIVIDAKAPLEILVDTDQDEPIERDKGQELVVSLRRHLLALKKRSYHSVIGDSPEFVVMFLPSESFLHW
ncbi:MAG TPA: DNA recombination protein RmuC, partial [Myxococcota bacterium]|nr:DNA recombination protein RmuC [Myxococcota bacterium]